MAVTQRDLAAQMLAQLRVLDPAISAEVGTPERKLLDTLAEALSDAQVDLTALAGAMDVDSKIGSNLDNFLALFGFARQQGTRATGYVTFSRSSAGTVDIQIPIGTRVLAPTTALAEDTTGTQFETLFSSVLPAGQTEVIVPVQAVSTGSLGNVAAGAITTFALPTLGLTGVTNDAPITGGTDREDDDALKVRFKNTLFRNLAGTKDQFLALAASTAFTTKANVVGPISRYREYVQVPTSNDSVGGNGSAGNYTTALSTIPYSKYTYTEVPNFVSNGKTGTEVVFYREDIDWTMNTTPTTKNAGDTYRFWNSAIGLNPLTDAATTYQPNVTFKNVYTGSDATVEGIRPGGIMLFEHSYLSTASRNDITRSIMNAVDVFIDGTNDTVASTVLPAPGTSTLAAFVNSPTTSKYLASNYRRKGFPNTLPTVGNLFMPLFWQPVVGLPDSITITGETTALTIETATFNLGEHYWLVEDVTTLYGTVRARNGIEWNPSLNGYLTSDVPGTPAGRPLNQFTTNAVIPIDNYIFDKNIVDLQTALEGNKQVTTDVLAHRAKPRYFKLDITVMYVSTGNTQLINSNIKTAIDGYFRNSYFGNVIQLSDILQVIHSVDGVDNVRWTTDVDNTKNRVTETDITGTALAGGALNFDFTIHDDELPQLPDSAITGDTLPGLIIRARAQNTWQKG